MDDARRVKAVMRAVRSSLTRPQLEEARRVLREGAIEEAEAAQILGDPRLIERAVRHYVKYLASKRRTALRARIWKAAK